MSSYNLPILSIVAYYVLAVYPHGHAVMLASRGNPKKWDNRNPKSSTLAESIKRNLPAKQFAKFERCESCHRNSLENMPLFVAAVLAGFLAEQKAGSIGLDVFCVSWMVTRILYTINYINTDTQRWSQLRSALYFIGCFLCFGMLVRSAKVLGSS